MARRRRRCPMCFFRFGARCCRCSSAIVWRAQESEHLAFLQRRGKLLRLLPQLQIRLSESMAVVPIAALAATLPASLPSSSAFFTFSPVGFFSNHTAALFPSPLSSSWRTGKGEQRQNGKCNGRGRERRLRRGKETDDEARQRERAEPHGRARAFARCLV